MREAGKVKGKRLSKDGVSTGAFTVMAGDSETQITPYFYPGGNKAVPCNPVPVKCGRAVFKHVATVRY